MGSVLKIDIVADGRKAASTFDTVGRKGAGMGKALAVGIGGAVLAAGAGAAALAVSAVKSASAVEQAFGATGSVFGKYAATVEKSAKGAATSVGLATSEYAGLANVLGSQLKNMGVAGDKLAPKTDALIKQGADLAATFGGSTADAVSAVSSLLKGERDPIEKYGVSIKAADVAARLQAKGLDGLTGPAKAAAEAQATLALLTEQTSSAQGAFTRESGTAAGQQQRLTAMWENAKATLGAGLLPVVTKVATFLSENVAPAVQNLAGRLATDLGPTINTVSAFVTGKLIPAARDTYRWFVTKIVPAFRAQVGPVLAALGPLVSKVAAFVTGQLIPAARGLMTWFVTKIVPAFKSVVLPVIAGLSSAFDKVKAAVERNRPQLETIGKVLKTVAEFIAAKVAPVVGKVLGGAFSFLGDTIGLTLGAVAKITDGISALVGWIQRAVEWLGRMKDGLSGGVGKVLDALPGFGLMSMGAAPAASAPAPFPGAGFAAPLSAPMTLMGPSSSAPLPALPDLNASVDNRVYITVDGALDPVGVAEQIRTLLLKQAKRTGRPLVVMA